MKAFTDIEQSKRIAKILPLESADMWWLYITAQGKHIATMYEEPDPHYLARMESYGIKNAAIPCWSLASLINVLPADWWGYNEHYFLEISKMGDASKPNKVCYYRFRKEIDGANYDRIPHISHSAENLIDACVNMIITLHEHKLI